MSLTQSGNACPAVLVGLDSLVSNGRINFNTKVGILQALLSPQNRTSDFTMEQLVSRNGHVREVRIAYRERLTEADVVDEPTCESGTPKPWFEDNFAVNLYSEISIDWTMADVSRYCEAFSTWTSLNGSSTLNAQDQTRLNNSVRVMEDAAQQVMKDLDALRIKIAKNAHAALVAGKGGYADGVTSPQSFQTLNSANGSLNDVGLANWELELEKLGSNMRPLVVGSNNMWRTVRALNYGCCNENGIDFGRMANAGARFDFFHDTSHNYTTIYGNANGFGAWLPNTFQIVTFLENAGNFGGEIDGVVYGTMPDPVTGLVYDIKLLPNGCGKKYNLTIGLHYGFYTPASPFKDGDRLEDVNGIVTGVSTSA